MAGNIPLQMFERATNSNDKDVEGRHGVLSMSGDAIMTTNYSDDYMIRGYCFGCEDILSMTKSGGATPTANFIFDTHGVDADKTIILNAALYNSSVGVILSEFYLSDDDDSYTGGTAMLCGNLNEPSTNEPQSCMKYGATQVTEGKTWTLYKKGAIGGAGSNQSSGAGSAGSVTRVLEHNRVYLAKFTNTNTADPAVMTVQIQWFEI